MSEKKTKAQRKRASHARKNLELNKTKALVSKPEASDERKDAKQTVQASPNIVSGYLSGVPKHNSETKANDPEQKRKDSKQIMRVLVAAWAFIRGIFGLLDKHQGSITALATVSIGFLTWSYVGYSKKQWETVQRQVTDNETATRARLVVELTPHITVVSSSAGAMADWNIRAKNVGGSVATEIAASGSIEEIGGTNGEFRESPQYVADLMPTPFPNGPHLAQGDTLVIPRQDQVGWWDEVIARKSIAIFHVKLSYRDIFGEAHIVPGCVYYSSPQNQFIPCPIFAAPRKE